LIPLFVDLETAWRGGQNQALLILKGLYERGDAAELITTKGSSLGHRAEQNGICVHYVSRKTKRWSAARKIREVMSDGRIELVHANEAHAVTAAWLARSHRTTPLVISRRVGYPLGQSWISRAKYAAAARIVANSKWVAEQAVNSGAQREKVTVIYEGAEIPGKLTPEKRKAARARWKVGENEPLLGCVGVLLPDKGQEWLIRSLAELCKEFPGAKLLLAGDGLRREPLKALAKELGVSNAVIFAGFVKDVESVYAALDVFLLPSFFEALNNSLMAAMAYEIPSIAFNLGALGEIIEDGKSGLLVSGPDVAEICGAIRSVLSDRDRARTLGEAGRRRVQEHFSAERMIDGTIGVYLDLLGMKRSASE
jgi:glycosyltransferase involved in cell wall biosynthesis